MNYQDEYNRQLKMTGIKLLHLLTSVFLFHIFWLLFPSKEIPGLISFRMDWLDLLAVQGTLKSLLQHHSSKAFFGTQLSL